MAPNKLLESINWNIPNPLPGFSFKYLLFVLLWLLAERQSNHRDQIIWFICSYIVA